MACGVRLAHIGVAYPHGLGYMESLPLMTELEVVALYDPDPGAARTLVPAGLSGLAVYDDPAVLQAKERPEAVVTPQPNDITPHLIVQAAGAGAHVFAEKPCARTAVDLMPAVRAIQGSGVQFATGYTRRVSPAGKAIKTP
jgi:myo-inositol 2-dehydrogenase/D-chiro-inositol 1-dehydrogenase